MGAARKQAPSQDFSAHPLADIVQNGPMTLRPHARISCFFSVTRTLSLVSRHRLVPFDQGRFELIVGDL